MKINLDPTSVKDYELFLKIKSLPKFSFTGRGAEFPDEYAHALGVTAPSLPPLAYKPSSFLFDYQAGISELAIDKRKFAAFVDPGYGKTLIMMEHTLHAQRHVRKGQGCLIVSPLMVIKQTIKEAQRFYPGIEIERVAAKDLPAWLERTETGRIGITNYEAMDESLQGNLGSLALDESSMLKSHYGKWGSACIQLGKGLDWKLALTGTPAPNDQIEYANHAVFMDAFPTVNSFLARFFVNRGQTDNRWELKPHALRPFYTALSHWSIFMANPSTYGWKDNAGTIPPIHTHIHDVGITEQQRDLVYAQTGSLFADRAGGITSRSVLSQIAKGNHKGESVETLKPKFIRELVDSFGPDRSTIIWCLYNKEQELAEKWFPEAISLKGGSSEEEREEGVDQFKAGEKKVLISKAKVLGFGLNLQRCTRQVFSCLQDSYETYFQCVKRSNRVGSTEPLEVHIPITPIERPMVDNVLRKAERVHADTIEQEQLFKEIGFHRRNHAA